MIDDQPSASQPDGQVVLRWPRARRSPLRAFIWTAVIGTGFGLLATLIVASLRSDGRWTELDADAIQSASERWDAAAPPSYDLELQVSEPRAQLVEVEVRERNVTKLLLDGVAPQQRRTWDYWSVPGLFDIIEADLARADESPPGQVRLFGEFDSKYGYPRCYRRIEAGAMRSAEWTVTRFQLIAD